MQREYHLLCSKLIQDLIAPTVTLCDVPGIFCATRTRGCVRTILVRVMHLVVAMNPAPDRIGGLYVHVMSTLILCGLYFA
jgi:hypothetical protein